MVYTTGIMRRFSKLLSLNQYKQELHDPYASPTSSLVYVECSVFW